MVEGVQDRKRGGGNLVGGDKCEGECVGGGVQGKDTYPGSGEGG